MTDCEKCKFDYICCIERYTVLTKEEVDSGKYEMTLITMYEKNTPLGVVMILPKDEKTGKCVYLTKDNKCSIYQDRPQDCKDYDCAIDRRLQRDARYKDRFSD